MGIIASRTGANPGDVEIAEASSTIIRNSRCVNVFQRSLRTRGAFPTVPASHFDATTARTGHCDKGTRFGRLQFHQRRPVDRPVSRDDMASMKTTHSASPSRTAELSSCAKAAAMPGPHVTMASDADTRRVEAGVSEDPARAGLQGPLCSSKRNRASGAAFYIPANVNPVTRRTVIRQTAN